jgi:hypothetical protein
MVELHKYLHLAQFQVPSNLLLKKRNEQLFYTQASERNQALAMSTQNDINHTTPEHATYNFQLS